MGAEAATADDLAQDAFLAAFEQITDFRGEGTFQAWVKRIAARLYVRHWRKAVHIDLLAETPEPEGVHHDGDEGAAHMAALRIDLDEALKSLAEPERLCVSLCYGGGLSHAEAAEALNTPLGTVKSHVKRGLDKLRRRMAPPEGGDGMERRVHG
jgi:RNA polymerase sigma factor (sigma-70 family)